MDLSTVLPGILLLGIVIFFHELGHFLAAKWRGVTVLKFSLGMGPEMIGFTAGGTRYCFSWIPLGGFVQMAGDSPNEDGSLPEGGQEQFLTHHWFGRRARAGRSTAPRRPCAAPRAVRRSAHGRVRAARRAGRPRTRRRRERGRAAP